VSASRGRFIVVEGIDGSGGTTQSRRLVESLRALGVDARHTVEPSGGVVGALIRSLLERGLPSSDRRQEPATHWATMALLFAADRLHHLETEVVPALETGAIVVSDRYDLSSLIYQSLTAPDGSVALPWIRELNRHALRPDLTLVLGLSVDAAEARRRERGGVEELFDARPLQERLADAYARAESFAPGDRLLHVSGAGEVEEVAERVLAAVHAVLPGLVPPA
jgi:dTMP kinase